MTPDAAQFIPSASLPELAGWVGVAVDGAEIVRAAENPRVGDFRPNIVLTSTPSTAPIEAASSVSIAAILAMHPGARIISVDLWDAQAAPGRRITASYPSGDTQIVVVRWIWANGARHIQLTASAATHQYLACAPAFDHWASQLELLGETAPTQRDPEVDPALDLWASARAGQSLELLERIVPGQPFVRPTLELSGAAQQALLNAQDARPLPRRSVATDELLAAGLLDSGRRPSAFARQLVAHWNPAALVIEASTVQAGVTRSLTLWVSGTSTAYAVDTAGADQRVVDDGTRAFGVIPIARTVDTILSFLGVGPAWTFELQHGVLTADAVDRHVQADSPAPVAAPEGANDATLRFWAADWSELRVRTARSSLRLISAGPAGLISVGAPTTPGGDAVLSGEALPSYGFYVHLLRQFQEALAE